MLIDGGDVVNLMPNFVFKKLGREDDDLAKTNLTLNGMCVCVGGGAIQWRLGGSSHWSSP
jgi:hypothetical protein